MIFNLVALLFVVAFIAIGTKKGFVRELMAFLGLCAALVITTGKLDFIAVQISSAIDASPLAVAIIAYIIILGFLYAIFKLIAKIIYKLISVQSLGQQDKYGGALIGAVRGFLIAGAVLFVTILLPLPRAYYTHLDQSVLAKAAAQSVQFLYDSSRSLHKTWPSFLAKVENTLQVESNIDPPPDLKRKQRSAEARLKEELALRAAIDKVNFFYGDAEQF